MPFVSPFFLNTLLVQEYVFKIALGSKTTGRTFELLLSQLNMKQLLQASQQGCSGEDTVGRPGNSGTQGLGSTPGSVTCGMTWDDNNCDDDHNAGNFLCLKSKNVEFEDLGPPNQGISSVQCTRIIKHQKRYKF